MRFRLTILDRYIIRESLLPFCLALGMFTFLLAVKPMLEQAQVLLTKGVDLPTVGFLLVTLLPQALGVTIPMAFLTGVLMALGRLSGDRESVAFLACGVSPIRLLRPVLIFALLAGAADMYLLIRLVPDSNQRFREVTYGLIEKQGTVDVKPGIFYEGFPGKVLFIQKRKPDGQWEGVMLADTSQPGRPTVTLAAAGRLELDPVKRQVAIVLPGESVRYVPGEDEDVYDVARTQDFRVAVSADSVFGTGNISPTRGRPEMTIAQLREAEAEKRAAGISPHPEILQRHQMFAFPVACLIFALVGLPLGLHTRKEGKLGGFTQGLAVIFLYYAILVTMESLTKGGQFPAEWARWIPNIVVGLIGIAAIRWRSRAIGRDLPLWLPSWPRPARGSTVASASKGPARPAVIIRVPHIAWPFPAVRILDRYVGRRYLNVSLLAFIALLGLYYIGTFIDKSERLFKGQATGRMLLEYFYYSTPQFVVYIVPMATLVAALATIGGLTRSSELTVMRACGVSLYRAAVPVLLVALVWSGCLFLLDDRVLAQANRRAEVLEDRIKGNLPHTVNEVANANWLVAPADPATKSVRIYYYTAFDIPRQTLYGLSVFETAPRQFRLISHTMTGRVTYARGAWQSAGGWVQRFAANDTATRDPFGAKAMQLEPPTRFSGMHNQSSDLMSFGELRKHIAQLSASGVNLAETRVQLQARVAFPLVTVVMTLLGIPFGVTTGRRGALYGVGLAIILASSYWLLNTFFVAVGQADLLSPSLAAWAANILFLAVAAYATLTVRT
ncbi:MAG: LptF/LptG family permease [Vicinamibacterales bacterium]